MALQVDAAVLARWEDEGGRVFHNWNGGTMAILVNKEGEFYGGFSGERCAPIWRKTPRSGLEVQPALVQPVVRQLRQLGYPVDVYTPQRRRAKK